VLSVLADQQNGGEAVHDVVRLHPLVAPGGEVLGGRQVGVHHAAPVLALWQLGKGGGAAVAVGVECHIQVATPLAPVSSWIDRFLPLACSFGVVRWVKERNTRDAKILYES